VNTYVSDIGVSDAPQIDQVMFRKVMGRFATGVTVVTTSVAGEVFGMTANAFMAGSLAPPLCVISIAGAARMHERLRSERRFGVSFLGQAEQWLSQRFSGRSPIHAAAPEFRYFGDVPVLAGCVGALAADVIFTAPCGDHTLFIGRVTAMEAKGGPPLLFYEGRYAALHPTEQVADIAYSFW
jgi:flavin reductase (DIM6/NTAB) family NADH-FMN oxidoreductase RutF